MAAPIVGVMYPKGFPAVLFQQFAEELSDETITVQLEEREPLGPQAGVVWSLLTQAGVFIAASYFGEPFKQLGKEHFEKLRKCLAELTQKTMDIPRIEPVLIGTSGKVNLDDPFSTAFSVYANLPNGRTVKLLIPKNNEGRDYAEITNAFLDFMKLCNETGDSTLVSANFDPSYRSNPITVAFNPDTNSIEWMDLREGR